MNETFGSGDGESVSSAPAGVSLKTTALGLLDRWVDHADRSFFYLDSKKKTGYYGGGYNGWGVQTNQKAVSALAVYGASASDRFSRTRKAHAMKLALAGLRFSLLSHLAGPGECVDGTAWGHTWISTLGIERMLHALPVLSSEWDADERALLRKVLCSEAGWLLRDYGRGSEKGIRAGLWARDGGNHPESNIWNGAFLWRIASLYPEHPDADAWREQALLFLANGISIANDANADRLFDGKPLRQRHIGPSFFPNYALDHHGYLNVGYMVICLSNVAMFHFDARMQGLPVPETLYLHADDLWATVKRMVFADGRLARIGGDSRVRYAYCQEYLMPALLLAADRFDDPHALGLLEKQLETVSTEAADNEDGSFYGNRLSWLREEDPVYYTRLESDRANALGMVAAYWDFVNAPEPEFNFEDSVAGGWAEPEHGAALHRSRHRLAAFSWRAMFRGQGMCQPPGDGNLAEWEANLTGRITFLGEDPGTKQRELIDQRIETFDGGFVTQGCFYEGMLVILGEGWRGSQLARKQMLFAALPDGQTVVGIEYATIGNSRVWVRDADGLHFNLPNDLFNGFIRRVETETGTWDLNATNRSLSRISLSADRLIADGRIGIAGIYGGDGFQISHPPERTGGKFRSLFVDTIHYGGKGHRFVADSGSIVADAGWMLVSHATHLDREQFYTGQPVTRLSWSAPGGRAVEVTGTDGRRYRIFANFETAPLPLTGVTWENPDETWTELVSGQERKAGEWEKTEAQPGFPLFLQSSSKDPG